MGGIDFKMDLSLETFDELCAPLVARLEACVHRALDAFQARLGADVCADRAAAASLLKAVEIVGGTTRVRCIKAAVSRAVYGARDDAPKLQTTMNADESVSRGHVVCCF